MPVEVSHLVPGFVIRGHKHGKDCVLAKVVRAWPSGETVIAMPTKSRRFSTPSLPPEALELARRAGATAWVIRMDTKKRCYRLELDQVEMVGEIGEDGELYVPMRNFSPCPWLEWNFVQRAIIL